METILNPEIDQALRQFLKHSRYAEAGGVITDLDGTAVHEDQGRVYIPPRVEFGLKRLYELGRPVVLNSLRFPLSVMRTFGREWIAIANAPIPVVSLYGSQIGFVTKTDEDELTFEEIEAFPLAAAEIDDVLKGVEGMVEGGIKDLLLFYYPRDWRMGEIIWTPVAEKVISVKEKYLSASAVTAVELPKLREQLHREEICMIFLLIEVAEDQLMAYQHTKRSNFFTHKGVDKLSGTREIARHLGLDLSASIGAGDSPMDVFLSGVGLAVHVGNPNLEFLGLQQTIKVKSIFELGDLLFRLADLQQEIVLQSKQI